MPTNIITTMESVPVDMSIIITTGWTAPVSADMIIKPKAVSVMTVPWDGCFSRWSAEC